MFPQVSDIAESLKFNKSKCVGLVDKLVQNGDLNVVFKGKGLPIIVVPHNMIESVLRTQIKPAWMKNYVSPKESEILTKIQSLEAEFRDYEQFGRLLYSTDIQLEEAVAYSMNWLGFQNVIHIKEDRDNADVVFDYNNVHGLIEVEGTIKAASKDKVAQLNGWVAKELNKNDSPIDIRGFLAVNTFRNKDPKERDDPLSQHAKKFLKIYTHLRYFTTVFLFEEVNKVLKNEITKEEARKNIWEGETIQ